MVNVFFESNDKFYFEDHGLRNAQAEGTHEGDIEKVIENIIYQHLIGLGYKVNVGQLQAGEIVFVCTKKACAKRIYIQAAYIIANDETREREFGNLHNIKDNYPKYVVSMTPGVTRNDDNGIIYLHLRNFLMLENLDWLNYAHNSTLKFEFPGGVNIITNHAWQKKK